MSLPVQEGRSGDEVDREGFNEGLVTDPSLFDRALVGSYSGSESHHEAGSLVIAMPSLAVSDRGSKGYE